MQRTSFRKCHGKQRTSKLPLNAIERLRIQDVFMNWIIGRLRDGVVNESAIFLGSKPAMNHPLLIPHCLQPSGRDFGDSGSNAGRAKRSETLLVALAQD